ncbi:hypothetical protein QAD02_017485 [Eretmocerus hayati]|uniref:Uncharacterized protein n=1 Tax=Eretmocerus hayati TaxID=131215 RepID=A0ACC2PF30_9HYME|nr:hypothetical protein QAD02_017485 [Eretmocerus hayati]
MDTGGFYVFLISTTTSVLFSLVIAKYRNKKKQFENEENSRKVQKVLASHSDSWEKVGTVSELWSYPLKSGRGKQLESADFTESGICIEKTGVLTLRDRMFILFNEDTKRFATARQHPKLVLVEVSPEGQETVRFKFGKDSFTMSLPEDSDEDDLKFFECTMWFKECVRCVDCGDEVSRWISRMVADGEQGLRLGMYMPKCKRKVMECPTWREFCENYFHLRNEDAGLFSDLASYMVLSQSSVDDLNNRLSKPIKPSQLRPNLVIRGCKPYAEDEWDWIKIGDSVIIRKFKLCTRCTMVIIDPDSGERDAESEPLKTLRTYRRLQNAEHDKLESYAPAMGIYCGLYRSGIVNFDDAVYILKDN